MTGIRTRAAFIHVDVPGQDENSANVENFPSMEALGGAICNILDNFNVKAAVGLGEGAGGSEARMNFDGRKEEKKKRRKQRKES